MKTLFNSLATALAILAFSLNANAQTTNLTVVNETDCEILVQAAAYNCVDQCLTAIVCIPPRSSHIIPACGAAGNHYEWVWAGVGPSDNCDACDPQFLHDLNSPFLTCTTPSGPFQITIPPCGPHCHNPLTAEFVAPDVLAVY